MQVLFNENKITKSSTITKSFLDIERMKIPIIQFSIMKHAIKCFKFLLLNGYDTSKTMKEEDRSYNRYEWDCTATAIFFGENEILKILTEKGIQREINPSHIEAAFLSYRNDIAEEIIGNMNVLNDREDEETKKSYNQGLIASAKSNNVKGIMYLIKKGANIKILDITYTNTIRFDELRVCNMNNKTLLHIAAENNSKEVGKILISKGANINENDMKSLTRLFLLFIKITKRKQRKWHMINRTPLHIAARHNSKDIGELLISKGADINAKDINYQKKIIIFLIKSI